MQSEVGLEQIYLVSSGISYIVEEMYNQETEAILFFFFSFKHTKIHLCLFRNIEMEYKRSNLIHFCGYDGKMSIDGKLGFLFCFFK